VRLFRARLGRYVATFEPVEAHLLADLVDQVRDLLANRRSSQPADPLAALTGMSIGPSTTPVDPAVARLLPDFSRDDPDLSAGLRMIREPEVIAVKDAAAVTLLDSLPRGGGTVRLDEATAQAWLAALNDVRLAFGVRLDIPPQAGGAPTDDDTEPEAVSADPDSAGYAMWMTYRWLTAVQESLVQALMGEA
jgi:hypothetical protein